MGTQEEILEKIAERKWIRINVRSICLQDNQVLVQKPSDDANACYAFIGGELEFGDLMVERLKKEYKEEIGIEPHIVRYLFVVENRFLINGKLVHGIEHYFQTKIEHIEVKSKEPHLTHQWLPIERLEEYDIRPLVVRDAIFDGSWETAQRLIAPLLT